MVKIISITDNRNNTIENPSIEIKDEISLYSSLKKSIKHLYINEIKITRNTQWKFRYECTHCYSCFTVSAVSILRNIRDDNTRRCPDCRNKGEEKRNKQSIQMTENNPKKGYIKPEKVKIKELEPSILRELAIADFQKEESKTQIEYFDIHITNQEYEYLKNHISYIDKFPNYNTKTLEYWDIYPSFNQMKYTAVLYNPSTKEVFQPLCPHMICENCHNIYSSKSIHKLKKYKKVLCRDCSLCNRIFKLRPYKLKNSDTILIQSRLEEKFVKYCEDNNINIINGPKVNYTYNNKPRTYRIDFLLPKQKLLIEIKDDHIWHKKQIETGIWELKETAAKSIIDGTTYNEYLLITPKNWNEMLNKIVSEDIV